MTDRRRDAATATIGLSGVAASGGMRHSALEAAYHGGKRPMFFQERKFITRAKVPGRRRYLAAAALGAVSVPPAAVGTSHLLRRETASKRDEKKRSFVAEGLSGAKDSFTARNESIAERPPARLVAGNYLAGAAVGSAAGGITHRLLRHVPGTPRAAAASAAGILAGSATLPLQSRATQHASHGKYVVTPTGVRRAKAKPVRPSRSANVVEGRPNKTSLSGPALRQQMVGKMSPRAALNHAGAVAGAHWTVNLSRAADRVEPARVPAKRSGRLVATGRTKAAETLRAVSYDVSSLNDKDKLVRDVATGQGSVRKDDPGASMSRGERRARVTAAGVPIPVVGDVAQATTAAQLSPEKYRRRTAGQIFAGNQAAGTAGNVVGAAGALALARHSPGFNQRAQSANDAVDRIKTNARSKVGLKPAGAGLAERALTHPKTPRVVTRGAAHLLASRAGRAVAANPKVAAIGALAGGAVAGQAGQQATYNHIMTRDDRYRRQHNQSARHGSKVTKADTGTGMSRRQELAQIRRKQRAAVVNAGTSGAGVASLGLLGAAALPHVKNRGRLVRAATVLGTASGGVSAANGIESAHLARQDLKARERQLVGKGLRPTGFRRAPSMRTGYVRQTRLSNGLTRVSTVRGGLA